MQLSGLHRRHSNAPSFANHSTSPMMFGRRDGVKRSAGSLHADATMARATSGVEWDPACCSPSYYFAAKDAPEIEVEPSIEISASLPDSCFIPDSCSILRDCTNQVPYVPAPSNTTMSTSQLGLPRNNEFKQLAFFLETTGPSPPHRRTVKAKKLKANVDAPNKVLQLLKLRLKRSEKTWPGAHQTCVAI